MDAKVVQQLHSPEIFPGDADEVEIHQTHLSVVCLAGDSAYKLKKAIRLPFVDFSTLERRRHFCAEEVRLNRRLCPDVYRGVVPLRRLQDGGLSFHDGADGEIIDYAVRMRRLPADRMMDRLLEGNAVTQSDIAEIARIAADFHQSAARSAAVNEAGDPRKLAAFALANFEETRALTGVYFDPCLHRILEQQTQADFDAIVPILERRVGQGRVVDGHGDLHSRNICLCDPIAIYDCIEFNPEFRCGDVATENAFLVMDLRYRGHPELAATYLDSYLEQTGDDEQRALMPALVRYRAMVRAKVSAIAASESELAPAEHAAALESVQRHFHLTAATTVEQRQPWLIIACGLPGSGKSSLFEKLSRETGWPCFSSDLIRKQLAGVGAQTPLPEACYSAEFSQRTYRELLERATARIDRRRVVLLDANYRDQNVRAQAREAAEKAGARFAIVWIDTAEEVVVERLLKRQAEVASSSDADLAVYRKLKADFEAPDAAECDRLISLDSAATTDAIFLSLLRDFPTPPR